MAENIPELHIMDSQTMAYWLERFVVEMIQKNRRSEVSAEIGIPGFMWPFKAHTRQRSIRMFG